MNLPSAITFGYQSAIQQIRGVAAAVTIVSAATNESIDLTVVFSQPVTGTTGFSFEFDVASVADYAYAGGEGTNTYVFVADLSTPGVGSEIRMSYAPGNVVGLAAFNDFPVTNNILP